MALHWNLVEHPHCVCANVEGSATLAEMQQACSLLANEVRATGHDCVLMDMYTVDMNLTTAEQFQLGKFAAEVFTGFRRVAALRPVKSGSGFATLVASNRGTEIKLFHTEAEAHDWLGQGEKN